MQSPQIAERPARPPIQARSLRTRAKLLEATVEALFDLGFAGAKTNLIAERAGVSQGALYRHFPTKIDLFASALAETLTAARDRFEQAFAGDPEAVTDPAGATFRHLWDVFVSPPLQGAFELYQAARTNPALAARVAPIIADHRARAVAGARALFPEAARAHEDFDGAVHALMSTMQGAAVFGALVPAEDAIAETQRRSIERMLRNELDQRRTG